MNHTLRDFEQYNFSDTEKKYKVHCYQCDYNFFTNSLPQAKSKCLIHDEVKPDHITNIEFLKGVSAF